jgi:MFS family permease
MTEPTGWRGRRGVVVTTLGVTQTLAWGSTYYLPAVMADPIAEGLHLSRSWFFGVFSAALLLSGLFGPLAGRMIDRHGGRDILTATSLIFAAGLGILSMASGIVGLSVAWAVMGVGMGFGLYEAAFATAAVLYGRDARNAITGITLIAGFASTIGWPASALFLHLFGWRGACLAWAALHLAIGLPLNRWLVPKGQSTPHAPVPVSQEEETTVPWKMIALAGIFAIGWFVSVAMAAHLPRLLEALGATPAAAVAAGALIGPAQVAARLFEFTFLSRVSPMISARLSTILHPIGAAFLFVLGAPGAFLFAVLHGGGNGLLTIARGTLPLALFGSAGYGLRTGLIAAPGRILQGGAPLLFSLVLDNEGPRYALLLSGSLMTAAFIGLLFVHGPTRETVD